MKKAFLFIAICLMLQPVAGAQEPVVRDTVTADSTSIRLTIYSVMPACVHLEESAAVQDAVCQRMASNSQSKVSGYRIRIYFDNGQQARNESENVLAGFKSEHPDIPAFRTFENSYFKVTVGNYRTRTDALRALGPLKASYPAAFIVEEKMRFPDF